MVSVTEIERVIKGYHLENTVAYRSALDFVSGIQNGSILIGEGLDEDDYERISKLWAINKILVVWLLDEIFPPLSQPDVSDDLLPDYDEVQEIDGVGGI